VVNSGSSVETKIKILKYFVTPVSNRNDRVGHEVREKGGGREDMATIQILYDDIYIYYSDDDFDGIGFLKSK